MTVRARLGSLSFPWTLAAWWFLCSPVFWMWRSSDRLLDTVATALLLSPVFLWRRGAQAMAWLLWLVGVAYLGYFLAVGTIPDEYFWFTLFGANLMEAAAYASSYRGRDGLLLLAWAVPAGVAVWWIVRRLVSLRPAMRVFLAVLAVLWLAWAAVCWAKGKGMQEALHEMERIYPAPMVQALLRQRLVQAQVFKVPDVAPPQRPARADVVVVVLGESASALRWSLLGYQKRDTNAALDPLRHGMVSLPVASNGNNTAQTVPVLLTGAGLDIPEQGVPTYLDWARAAGFAVTTLSNSPTLFEDETFYHAAYHRRSDAYVQLEKGHDDSALSPLLRRALTGAGSTSRVFVNMHTYGSHPRLERRYPQQQARWDDPYDNSIAWTSELLGQWIRLIDAQAGDRRAVLLYISDHGLNLPDCGGQYTHGQAQSAFQVPFLLWTNAAFREDQLAWTRQVRQHARPADDGLPQYDNRVFAATVADLLGYDSVYPSLGQVAAVPPPQLNGQPFAELARANACNVLAGLP